MSDGLFSRRYDENIITYYSSGVLLFEDEGFYRSNLIEIHVDKLLEFLRELGYDLHRVKRSVT